MLNEIIHLSLSCFNKDDVPPRYADTGARQSRARLDYDYGGSASQYGDAYGDRLVLFDSKVLCFYSSLN